MPNSPQLAQSCQTDVTNVHPENLRLGNKTSPSHLAVTTIIVVVPFLGVLFAAYSTWGWGVRVADVIILIAMYLGTGLGITVGYHRMFTHRAFDAVRPIKLALAILGSMAVQGPVLDWVATHRQHHHHSDCELDPHSTHHHGGGIYGILAGWWHAHIGWMVRPHTLAPERYIKDLRRDRDLQMVTRSFGVWVALGLVIPTVAGGLVSGTWTGAFLGFVWGGLVRVFLVHHITFSINSVCHLWGTSPYDGGDESRNNAIFGLLGLGEGWHNNHHAFPHAAQFGHRWWQIDIGYMFIVVLRRLGLVYNVRLPAIRQPANA